MIDPYLVALVRAAEAGTSCPRIWMTLTSGDLLSGIPSPSRRYVEESFQSLTRRYIQGQQKLQVRGRDERLVAAEQRATEEIKPFNVEIDAADANALTLTDVRVLWGGRGDGATMTAVRLNLDAIAVWWVAGGKEFKGGTGAFFVGVAVPLET